MEYMYVGVRCQRRHATGLQVQDNSFSEEREMTVQLDVLETPPLHVSVAAQRVQQTLQRLQQTLVCVS